jgi:hypothetical protein
MTIHANSALRYLALAGVAISVLAADVVALAAVVFF